MLTRRQVLKGTAAGSIAAIASARGVVAAASTPPTTPATPPGVPIPYPNTGFDAGYGTLMGGAAVAFMKDALGFSFFIKFDWGAAQVFYKEDQPGTITPFLKFFLKGMAVTSTQEQSFDGFLKEAGFYKVAPDVVSIFLKYEVYNSDGNLEDITIVKKWDKTTPLMLSDLGAEDSWCPSNEAVG
jgi:hypothetical protein